MPKHIGLRKSTFQPDRYLSPLGPNDRDGEITTQGILESVDALHAAAGAMVAAAVMESPFYIQER